MFTLPSLTVVVPALNEEENLGDAVAGLKSALEGNGIDWEIILVDDGSTDNTPALAQELASREPRIKVLRHQRPEGIGSCFRDGIEACTKEAVTWFPGDNENQPHELVKYLPLLEHVDIINPFVINKQRPRGRRLISRLYTGIINLSFGTQFRYTTGNVIYRRGIFDVVKPRSNAFIYQSECLVKAMRAGFTVAEVPVLLGRRAQGHSKILTPKSILRGIKEYLRLLYEVYILRPKQNRTVQYPLREEHNPST